MIYLTHDEELCDLSLAKAMAGGIVLSVCSYIYLSIHPSILPTVVKVISQEHFEGIWHKVDTNIHFDSRMN